MIRDAGAAAGVLRCVRACAWYLRRMPGMLALVVDDQESDALAVELALVTLGWRVELAAGPAAPGLALDRLTDPAAEPPALVLLDQKMPGLDGLGLLRLLRDSEANGLGFSYALTTVYIVSGIDRTPPIVRAAMSAGASGWLEKQISYADLCRITEDIDQDAHPADWVTVELGQVAAPAPLALALCLG